MNKIYLKAAGTNNRKMRGWLLAVGLLASAAAAAQLSVNTTYSPQQLVEQFLIGNGVLVSNVVMGNAAQAAQIAAFTNQNSKLGMTQGVLLSTGTAANVAILGNNTVSSFTSVATGCSPTQGLCQMGDADLTAMIGAVTRDAAVLEFDFVPLADSVRFRYVFASEEYNEYTCSAFNDAFAFILSSPSFPAQNIAKIPNTNQIVTINSVNNGSVGSNGNANNCKTPKGSLANANLFVDNWNGAFIQFDGMTIVLEASALVNPCDTYHLKIAIADALDGAFDSAIFLEANSLYADAVKTTVQTLQVADSLLVEGCQPATVTLQTQKPVAQPRTIAYQLLGNAVPNVDYTILPANLVIPAGAKSFDFQIIPLPDGIQENTDTVYLVLQTATCKADTLVFFIEEETIFPAPTVVCTDSNALHLSFTWNAIPNATGYQVSTDGGATWQTVTDTAFSFFGLSPATSKTLLVRATGGKEFCNTHLEGTATGKTVDCSLTLQLDSLQHLTCFKAGNGSISVAAIGGTPPYTYLLGNAAAQSSPTFSHLTTGKHTITVWDKDSCSANISVWLKQPVRIGMTIDTLTPASCANIADGAVQLFGKNGIGTTYMFTLGGGSNTTGFFQQLASGTHLVNITDGNGCTTLDSFTIPSPPAIQLQLIASAPNCFGETNGNIIAQPSGGQFLPNTSWTYLWSIGATTDTIANIGAGTYSVTVTDGIGCQAVATQQLAAPAALAVGGIVKKQPTCFMGNDGTLTIQVGGGKPPYQYNWLNYSSTTNALPNIGAGTYSVTVTDANGCNTAQILYLSQPAPIVIQNIEVKNTSCFALNDGKATVYAPSDSNYTFFWMPSNQTSASATGLAAGKHFVNTTNAAGCSRLDSVFIQQPLALTLQTSVLKPASCFRQNDGAALAFANGGTPFTNGNYTYLWQTIPQQHQAQATQLRGGDVYAVTATDANGCQAVASVAIPQPDSLALSLAVVGATCSASPTGRATANPKGGTPPYSFLWESSNTNATDTALLGGNYTLVVTDAAGCTVTADVMIPSPPPFELRFQTTDIACRNAATGNIQLLVAGSKPPYSFLWQDGDSTARRQALHAGIYRVTVSDANSCIAVDSIELLQPTTRLHLAIETTAPRCHDAADGRLSIQPHGGKPPYWYQVNDQPPAENTQWVGLTAGTHTISVTDGYGCLFDTTAFIETPLAVTVFAGNDKTIQAGDSATLIASAQNAVAPLFYRWSPAATLLHDSLAITKAFPMFDTRYTVQLTDARGCQATDWVMVYVLNPRPIHVATAFSPNADGVNDYLFPQTNQLPARAVLSFEVYDRWGAMVFSAKDFQPNVPELGWDGTFQQQPLSPDTFVWRAITLLPDGSRLQLFGNTVLVR